MALFGKVGGILKQTLGKQVDLLSSPSNPSIFQALRWMSSSKIFIGGLSYATDDNGLREAFSNYGEVHDARVIQDRETGRSRGFGFVTYTSSEEASSAIQALDGQDLHGRRIRVAYATDRARPSGGYGGGGYGGGGYGGGGYGGGGSSYGGGGYGGDANQGGNYGGGYGANQGGNYGGGGYGSGGFGSGNQGGVDGYASGGTTYGAPESSNASYGGGANFGVSGGTGGNVTSNTSFGTSGFEEESGLGNDGGNDQFGIGATSGVEDQAGDYEPNEVQDRDEDENENDDYAKKA